MVHCWKSFIIAGVACLSWSSVAQSDPSLPSALPSLTLEEARAMALENNPQLKSSEAGWRASEGAARQAGAFLNPSVEVPWMRDRFGCRCAGADHHAYHTYHQ